MSHICTKLHAPKKKHVCIIVELEKIVQTTKLTSNEICRTSHTFELKLNVFWDTNHSKFNLTRKYFWYIYFWGNFFLRRVLYSMITCTWQDLQGIIKHWKLQLLYTPIENYFILYAYLQFKYHLKITRKDEGRRFCDNYTAIFNALIAISI